jgi:hypothetical protein
VDEIEEKKGLVVVGGFGHLGRGEIVLARIDSQLREEEGRGRSGRAGRVNAVRLVGHWLVGPPLEFPPPKWPLRRRSSATATVDPWTRNLLCVPTRCCVVGHLRVGP